MTGPHPNDPAPTRPEGPRMPAAGEAATRSGEAARLADATPTWAARALGGVGVAAGALVAGAPVGLGVALTLLALGAIAARVPRLAAAPRIDLRERAEPPHDCWTRAWWALAAALALVPVLRAAAWVVVPALLVAAGLASLAASGGRRWGELVAGAGVFWLRVPAGAATVARAAARGLRVSQAGPAARGAALAAALLAVFVPLLASADAAFAQLLEDAVPAFSDEPLARALVAAFVAALGGALLHVRLAPPRVAPLPAKRTLGRLEWTLALGALVTLFAAFVALQLTTLFGGNTHVLTTAGLTYAEYARSGFWQLLAVAALTFAVVAAARRWARDDHRLLLTALCLLTLVVLASALKRLELLEQTYGFTRLRVAAHAALLWLAVLFVLVLAARFRAGWLPRALVATTAAAVLAFALADPERWIADRNVDRFERTGRIDLDYLARLGPDAAPALARLERTACLRGAPGQHGIVSFNLARERARALSERCDAPRTRTAR